MKNIDHVKQIVDTFYAIKGGITLEELYALCNASTKEEVDAKITELADGVKIVGDKVLPIF